MMPADPVGAQPRERVDSAPLEGYTKNMRWISRLMVPWLLLALAGCEENLDPATPEGAMHQLREAVMAKDVAAILDASSASTRKHLAELHTAIKAQRTAIEERYPEEEKAAAKSSYPKGALEAKDSAELFAALTEPGLADLTFDDGLRYGMTTLGRANARDDRATVTTHSGETIEFVLEEGKWKTTVFERIIESNLNRARLNQQTLDENLRVFDEMRRRAEKEKAKAAEAAKP